MPKQAKLLETPTEAPRKSIPEAIKRQVDAEAGYRCGNPRCQTAVAVEYHHMVFEERHQELGGPGGPVPGGPRGQSRPRGSGR